VFAFLEVKKQTQTNADSSYARELFFRRTKMAYISIAPEEFVAKITQSKPVSYFAIRKRIDSHKQPLR
jgi:hypothetical protein